MAGLEQGGDVTPLPLGRPAVAAISEGNRLEVGRSGGGVTPGRCGMSGLLHL
jgi:hypothetical protein